MKKGLYIVATPIGNLGDISPRAVETLAAADLIACEDTRITKKLFSLLGISLKKRFVTLHDHNEYEHAQILIDAVNREGLAVALVSDAGSPLISDPGYKLIRACREQGVEIFTLPGCCALICALAALRTADQPLYVCRFYSQQRQSPGRNLCRPERFGRHPGFL